jgi:hypothetical protein
VTPKTLERPLPDGPRVVLRHERAYTRDTIASIERAVPLSHAVARLAPSDVLSALVGVWRSYGRTLRLTPRMLGALRPRNAGWDLDRLQLVFPARVVVRLRTGQELVAERREHPGQAGRPEDEIDRVIRSKNPAYTRAG